MRGNPYIVNVVIFMFAFNALSLVLLGVFAYVLDFCLGLLWTNYGEIQSFAAPVGMVIIVAWFGMGLLLSHLAAMSASYEDNDFEDSIKNALIQFKVYLLLCFSLGKKE